MVDVIDVLIALGVTFLVGAIIIATLWILGLAAMILLGKQWTLWQILIVGGGIFTFANLLNGSIRL